MLILTNVNVEVTAEGTRYALCFGSPRCPGFHYKIETDAGTAKRLQTIIHTEMQNAMQAICESDDEDDSDEAFRL